MFRVHLIITFITLMGPHQSSEEFDAGKVAFDGAWKILLRILTTSSWATETYQEHWYQLDVPKSYTPTTVSSA